jgi:sec-independent protein translocase protein TatC
MPKTKDMTILEHFVELRSVLIKILAILSFGFILSYAMSSVLVKQVVSPLNQALAEANFLSQSNTVIESSDLSSIQKTKHSLVYLNVFDQVLSELSLAFWFSLIMTAPFWFYQIWSYILPALYDDEVKIVRPFFVMGFFLFFLGVWCCHQIFLPNLVKLLLAWGNSEVTAMLSLRDYVGIAIKLYVFTGFIFQIPNVLLILGFMGYVTKPWLKKMRSYIYVGLGILAAILTPPDVVTLIAIWVPMVILYEFGILCVGWIVHPYLYARHTQETMTK